MSDRFADCLLDVKNALDQTMTDLKPVLARKYRFSEFDVDDVYRRGLVQIAVEARAKSARNISPDEISQLVLHVNHLIAGAVISAADRLSRETWEEAASG
jgi:hypothetical protein